MFISTNKSGLCNRLKSFVSIVKMAKENNSNSYKMKWDVLDDYNKDVHILNCPFNYLFLNNIEVDKIESGDKTFNSHCFYIAGKDNIPKNFNTFKSFRFTPSDRFRRNIDFMYNKIPENIKNEYIDYFKILKPIEKIHMEIDEFKKFFNKDTISVHIRSWNRNGENSRHKYFYNLKKIEDRLNQYPNKNFFLSTDSEQVKIKLKQMYKDRLIFYPRKTSLNTSRDYPEGIQEDLIELYLLSKNKFIIGSKNSSFTEVAWYLASCPKDLIII